MVLCYFALRSSFLSSRTYSSSNNGRFQWTTVFNLPYSKATVTTTTLLEWRPGHFRWHHRALSTYLTTQYSHAIHASHHHSPSSDCTMWKGVRRSWGLRYVANSLIDWFSANEHRAQTVSRRRRSEIVRLPIVPARCDSLLGEYMSPFGAPVRFE